MSLWRILEAHNRTAVSDADRLLRSLRAAEVLPEIDAYRERIVSICGHLQIMARKNLADIAREKEIILEDVLSSTQQVLRTLRLLSARMVAPVLRASKSEIGRAS